MPGRSVTSPDPTTRPAAAAEGTTRDEGARRHPARDGGAGRTRGDGGADPPVFWHRFTASDRSTRDVLADLMAELRRAGLAADDLSNAELVLAEVLNNIAEHAYAEGSGPVELRVEVQRQGLACTVADRGRALPSGMVPDPQLPRIAPPDHLPEGGFGWHIIRCLTTEMAYFTEGEWNRLSLRLPWAD